jgi:hypothetical protein
MVSAIIERVMWWRKSQRKRNSRELIVLLDKDSFERFERLKTKIPAFNNNEVIASALLCLEHKTDRIVKRQITKRIRMLKNEGHSPQQIADYLKKKGIPALAGMDKWESETISSLLETETGNLVNRAKTLHHTNQQT